MNYLYKSIKILISGLLILGITFPAAFNLQAAKAEEVSMPQTRDENMLLPHSERKAPEYVPGELIIKLKDGKSLADIQELNAKYNVASAETVFKKEPSARETLQQLKDKLSDLSNKHESWYWQMDKNSKEYKEYDAKIEREKEELRRQITDQEELVVRLEQRQKRAPKDTVGPHLKNMYVLTADHQTDIRFMMEEYNADPNVEYAEPNYIVRAQLPLDSFRYFRNRLVEGWDLFAKDGKSGLELAGKYTGGPNQGKPVIVAVLDTGIDYKHEDISANMWKRKGKYGFDFVNSMDKDGDGDYNDPGDVEDDDPMDDNGHGTGVAGIIAATGDNGKGITGFCPQCRVMAVKILSADGRGATSWVLKAFSYAIANGAEIVNCSFGVLTQNKLYYAAIEEAQRNGLVVVAAAGNENIDANYSAPANEPYAITVASIGQSGSAAINSNWGSKIDVAAPGISITTLGLGNTYAEGLSGTSLAAPHVAGLAALILSRNHGVTAEQVNNIILNGAYDGQYNGWYYDGVTAYARKKTWLVKLGYGEIDVFRSLKDMDMRPLPQVKLYGPGGLWRPLSFSLIGSAALPDGESGTFRIEYTNIFEKSHYSQGITLANGGKTPVVDGELARVLIPEEQLISLRTEGGAPVIFRLTVSDTKGNNYYSDLEVAFGQNIKPGWPQILRPTNPNMTNVIVTPSRVAVSPDFKRILGIGEKLHLFDKTGKVISAFPEVISDMTIGNSIAMADIDPSAPGMEVIAGGKETTRLTVYYEDSSRPPLNFGTGSMSFLCLADTNGDSWPEIIVIPSRYNYRTTLKIIDRYGELKESDDIQGYFRRATAIDIDRNGKEEVLVSCESNGKKMLILYDGECRILRALETPNLVLELRLADLDNDKHVEILALDSQGITVYRDDFSPYFKIEQKMSTAMTNYFIIADLDRDGKPELITRGKIYRNDGTFWKNTPVSRPFIAADFDGDKELEILGRSELRTDIYDINSDTTSQVIKGAGALGDSYATGDFDGDGLNEILCVDSPEIGIYLVDTPGIYQSEGTWPQEHYDSLHSNFYNKEVFTGVARFIAAPILDTPVALSPKIVNLSWQDNSSNEDSFEIEVSFNGTDFTRSGAFSANTTTVNRSAKPNTKYWYRVRASKGEVKSDYSETKEVTTPDEEKPLALPPTLDYFEAKAISQSQIQLKWIYHNKPVTWDGFKIERALQENGPFTQIATIPQGPYIDSNLNPGTKYYYRIKAYNQAGDSVSSEAFATTNKPVENSPAGTEPSLGKASVSEKPVIPPAVVQAPAPASQGVIREIVLLSPVTNTMPETKPQAAKEESTSTPKLEKTAEPKAAPKPEEKKAVEPKEEKPAPQEEQSAVKSSPSMNLLATHNENGTLKAISVLDDSAKPIRDYAVNRDKQAPVITLTSGDTQVQVALNEKSKAAQVVKVAKGAGYAEIKKEVSGILEFMGYRMNK